MKHFSLYDGNGNKVPDTKARELVRNGEAVHDPNGQGYRTIANRLGFTKLEVEDWTSSAGDWTFRIRGGFLFQTNRYPLVGFSYTIGRRDGSEWRMT